MRKTKNYAWYRLTCEIKLEKPKIQVMLFIIQIWFLFYFSSSYESIIITCDYFTITSSRMGISMSKQLPTYQSNGQKKKNTHFFLTLNFLIIIFMNGMERFNSFLFHLRFLFLLTFAFEYYFSYFFKISF